MRFLADENLPYILVAALRRQGRQVVWIAEEQPGLGDKAVLDWAVREERIILTFDKDFGSLAFQHHLPASCGVILLRFSPQNPETLTRTVLRALASREEWRGYFAVIDERRIRLRPLPPTEKR